MNTLKAVFTTLVGFLAPVYMLLFIWLIRWDSVPTWATDKGASDEYDPSFVVRGDLPGWLSWAQTMDARFPGGVYEPQIKAIVGGGALWRRLLASYVWCGLRNRAQGLAFAFGHQTTDYIPDPFSTDRDRSNWIAGDGVWTFVRGADRQVWMKFWWGHLITGHQVYRLQDGRFWAVPVFTVKR